MTAALPALMVGGSAISAYGQMQAANAAGAAYDFDAMQATQNAKIATQKQQWAAELGDQDAAASQMGTAAKIGSIKANQAASGVEVGTGSNADVITSAREIGMLDALTIRSNAAREAYGYEVEAYSNRSQAAMSTSAAKNTRAAGRIQAAGTLLGGAAQAAPYSSYLSSKSTMPSSSLSKGVPSGAMSADRQVLAGVM